MILLATLPLWVLGAWMVFMGLCGAWAVAFEPPLPQPTPKGIAGVFLMLGWTLLFFAAWACGL